MKKSRQLSAASAALALAIAAGLALSGCRAREAAAPPPGAQEMKLQQTPVSSIYDEKGGVLYERPERPPLTPTPTPAASAPAPSPSSSAPRASEDKPGRGLPAEALAEAGRG